MQTDTIQEQWRLQYDRMDKLRKQMEKGGSIPFSKISQSVSDVSDMVKKSETIGYDLRNITLRWQNLYPDFKSLPNADYYEQYKKWSKQSTLAVQDALTVNGLHAKYFNTEEAAKATLKSMAESANTEQSTVALINAGNSIALAGMRETEKLAQIQRAQTAMQATYYQKLGAEKDKAETDGKMIEQAIPSHIAQWDALLARATDPVVFAVQRRIVQSEEILYSQLHRHLHRAVFADDDVIMLEQMPRTALRGRFEASDMIGLLCWLAHDIEENVELDVSLPDNIRGLAEDFAERHLLHHDASLFGTDCQSTRDDLRTIFEEVRRYHPPVDADTEDIIEVIENYLYAGKKLENSGTDQHDHVLFGSELFDIWEMLCLHHAYENDIKNGEKVLIADGGNLPEWLQGDPAFMNNFVLRTTYPAQLKAFEVEGQRPDLILYKEDEKTNTVHYRVIDFKYYQWGDLRTKPDPDKLNDSEKKFFLGVAKGGILNLSKSDIAKSLGYAQSVMRWHNYNEKMLGKKISINMEFWLPSDRIFKCVKMPKDRTFKCVKKPNKTYSAGELHAKPITSMIDKLLKTSNRVM